MSESTLGLELSLEEGAGKSGKRGHYVGGEVSPVAALAFKILMRMYGISQKAAVDKAGRIIARDLIKAESDEDVSFDALLKVADKATREYFFNLSGCADLKKK